MAAAGGHWLKIAQGDVGKLVFVPKGRSATEMITGRRAAPSTGFPGSLSETQKIKGLGGSTGATLVQDPAGNLYVRKGGASAGHLLEESAADTAYQTLGVDVAPHKIYQTPGGPVKMAKFVEGQTLDTVQSNNPAAYQKAVTTLQKNFAADAYLANWDVIGLGKDNILIGTNGKVYRIDNGGALRYRAQGGKKTVFGEFPTEIFTMRSQGQAGAVFGSMKLGDVASQAKALSTKVMTSNLLGKMPASLKPVMTARAKRMNQFSKIYTTLKGKGKSDSYIENYTKKLWEGLQSGKITNDPFSSSSILSSAAGLMGS